MKANAFPTPGEGDKNYNERHGLTQPEPTTMEARHMTNDEIIEEIVRTINNKLKKEPRENKALLQIGYVTETWGSRIDIGDIATTSKPATDMGSTTTLYLPEEILQKMAKGEATGQDLIDNESVRFEGDIKKFNEFLALL